MKEGCRKNANSLATSKWSMIEERVFIPTISSFQRHLSVLSQKEVGKLFAPGAKTQEIADYIKNWVAENRDF